MPPTIESLDRELRELRAELAITQTALADLAACYACGEPDPDYFIGLWSVRIMGLAHNVSAGPTPTRLLRGIERMASWAEDYVSLKLRRVQVVRPAAKDAAG